MVQYNIPRSRGRAIWQWEQQHLGGMDGYMLMALKLHDLRLYDYSKMVHMAPVKWTNLHNIF